jgi:hypothetical protein
MLAQYVKKPVQIKKRDEILKKEGVIFFDLDQTAKNPTSGHISLWYDDQVADRVDLFNKAPRIYFFDFTPSAE